MLLSQTPSKKEVNHTRLAFHRLILCVFIPYIRAPFNVPHDMEHNRMFGLQHNDYCWAEITFHNESYQCPSSLQVEEANEPEMKYVTS